MKFVPLNIKTNFSLMKSSILINDLIDKAKSFNYESLAINDENVYGFPFFASCCQKNNIKPIYGVTILLNLETLTITCCLFIQNEKGYLNLCNLLNKRNGPINLNDLSNCNEGLFIIVPLKNISCLDKNIYSTLIKLENTSKNVYYGVEIYSLEDETMFANIRLEFTKHNLKLIAFPQIKYLTKQEDYKLDILKAITDQTNIQSNDLNLNNLKGGPYFLISENVARKIYTEEEIDNTSRLASSITFNFFQKRGCLMKFSKENLKEELHKDCLKFLTTYFNSNIIPNNYIDRLNKELDIIESMGYLDYFALVRDYVTFAKNKDIYVGPGRGSAASSIVAFSLGITEIDPLKFDLIFERFLNPLRISMPDIDIDFQDNRRDEVISYLKQKYGEDKVTNIIAFQTIKPKRAIRDICKVFCFPEAHMTKMLSTITNEDSFSEIISNNSAFKQLIKDAYYHKMYLLAKSIEGSIRSISMHAAGVIINNEPVYKTIPLAIGQTNLVTSFDMIALEKLGYLKMDLLGLQNLTFLKAIEDNIKTHDKLPAIMSDLNNQKVYFTLNKLLLNGIFQLESYGIKKAIELIKPMNIEDLYALIALYRPGPMDQIATFAKNKQKDQITYVTPLLEPILRSTYGVIIYQEQIIEIAKIIAGFDGAKADLFRYAISKKKEDIMESLKKDFFEGSSNNNIPLDITNKVYAYIEKFANYGFNKAHSVSYSLITYKLLYYKTFYPADFYCASLDKISANDVKFIEIIKEMKIFNIAISKLSINESGKNYSSKGNIIIPPLKLIKGLNDKTIELIIEERKKGRFSSLEQLCERISKIQDINLRNILPPLINSGALDEFNLSRAGMLLRIDELIEQINFGIKDPINYPSIKNEYKDLLNEKNTISIILSTSLAKFINCEKIKEDEFLVLARNSLKNNNLGYYFNGFDEINEYVINVREQYDIQEGDIIFIEGRLFKKIINARKITILRRINNV